MLGERAPTSYVAVVAVVVVVVVAVAVAVAVTVAAVVAVVVAVVVAEWMHLHRTFRRRASPHDFQRYSSDKTNWAFVFFLDE
jgi:Flp pilus assembly protein TadB